MLIQEAINLAREAMSVQEAYWLVEHVTGFNRAKIILHHNETFTKSQKESLLEAINARRAKVPLAYILGHAPFCGYEFMVNKNVLVPREDSQVLVQWAVESLISKLQNNPSGFINVLELGVGSGALISAIYLEVLLWMQKQKRLDAINFIGTDISEKALIVARQNFEQFQINIKTYCGDWFAALPPDTPKFDLILSNPPYIAADDPHLTEDGLVAEPQIALTDGVRDGDGTAHLRTIIENASCYLTADGALGLEHGYNQGEWCRECMKKHHYREIATIADDNEQPRVTVSINR